MVFTILHPSKKVPNAMVVAAMSMTGIGTTIDFEFKTLLLSIM